MVRFHSIRLISFNYVFLPLHHNPQQFDLSIDDLEADTNMPLADQVLTIAQPISHLDCRFILIYLLTSQWGDCLLAVWCIKQVILRKFIERSRLLDPNNNILKEGSLHIDVLIQIKDERNVLCEPSSPLSRKMMSYLESEENADVSFIVDGKTFKAHSPILQASAPMLARRQRHDL